MTREDGKVEVGFPRSNGTLGAKFEVYNNIDALHKDAARKNYAAPSF